MLITSLSEYIKSAKGAIHIGAHDGSECSWYVDVGYERVLWFEPNRILFSRLRENIKKYSNQVAFNFGIHDSLKEAVLHISSNDAQSSSILEFGTHLKYHPNVKVIGSQMIRLMRIDDFFRDYYWDVKSFDFVNIDTEGTELNVLKSFGNLIKKIKYIYTEIHEEEIFKGGALVDEIDNYLLAYGFSRQVTKLTGKKWGDALYIRK